MKVSWHPSKSFT